VPPAIERALDDTGFFGLRPPDASVADVGTGAEAGVRAELPVTEGLCSGLGTLFGGSALGAAAEVLTTVTGRSPLWLAGQFVSFARPGDVVALEVQVLAEGRRFTQARLVGRTGTQDVFHVAATLGAGGRDLEVTHVVAPTVEPPEQCPPRPMSPRLEGTVLERMDLRLARDADDAEAPPGSIGPGRTAFWARIPQLGAVPSALAILGDMIPAGVVQSLGRRGVGSSLDHSLRVHRVLPADWLLVDVRVQAIAGGVAHALAHLFDEDGPLRGTASQTTSVRLRE
jgi:acyl-CoA thioesterase II